MDILCTETFDVALIDYNMPYLIGPEVAQKYREQESADQHLTIIALTASALLEDHERCRAAGMDDVLSKPVRRNHLLEVLANVFL